MFGTLVSACTTAYAMRWVKLTLPPPPLRRRWLLRIWRLTSSSLAGTTRSDVAVGTVRLASMFSTMRAAAPRRGTGCSPSRSGAVLVCAGDGGLVLTTGLVGVGAGAGGAS